MKARVILLDGSEIKLDGEFQGLQTVGDTVAAVTVQGKALAIFNVKEIVGIVTEKAETTETS